MQIWYKIWKQVCKNLNIQEKKSEFALPRQHFYLKTLSVSKQKKKTLMSGHMKFTKFLGQNLNDSDKIGMNGRFVYMWKNERK